MNKKLTIGIIIIIIIILSQWVGVKMIYAGKLDGQVAYLMAKIYHLKAGTIEKNDDKLVLLMSDFIENKNFESVVRDLDKEGKNILLLDKKGEDVRDISLRGNEVFIIGDQDGFPASKNKFLKGIDKVSVGPRMLFASQVLVLLHGEVDRRG